MPIRKAFLTGSRVYGKPRPDSDIDLVILIEEKDLNKLIKMADETMEANNDYDPKDARCLRFGKLNLLCCLNPKHFDVWKSGTDELLRRKRENDEPVSRDTAISFLSWLRRKEGITEKEDF